LRYAADLEKTRIGDLLASDLAEFYANLPEAKLPLIKQAQEVFHQANVSTLKSEFAQAIPLWKRAIALYLQIGDLWLVKLCEYNLAVCLYFDDQFASCQILWEKVTDFCQTRNYKWLLGNTLYWVAVLQGSRDQIYKSVTTNKRALTVAEEIKDSILLQRVMLSMALNNNLLGDAKAALGYLHRVFEEASILETDLRQKWRNCSFGTEILTNFGLYSAAKAAAFECRNVTQTLDGSLFTIHSQIDTGIILTQTGDFTEAGNILNEAKQNIEKEDDNAEKAVTLARVLANLGHLERKAGNHQQAVKYYEESANLIARLEEQKAYLYAVRKGQMLSYLALNNGAELEKQIPLTIDLAEKYRQSIVEEQSRNVFFDNEQNIYDIAVEHEVRNANYEKAYNYAETSNSRSLLDWLNKGAKFLGKDKNIEIILSENTQPLKLREIQQKIPANAQLLQYTILEKRVAIWLISKEKFEYADAPVQSEELVEKVQTYLKQLPLKSDLAQAEARKLGQELYGLLIAPIKNRLDPNKEICIIPHKILFQLPFAALMSPEQKPLLAEFSLFNAPSANVFLLCTEHAVGENKTNDETLLSIGNPKFDQNDFNSLQDLPFAKDEALAIAEFYNKKQILKEVDATKTNVLNSLKGAEIVHFAGHYLVRGVPLSSGLVLAKQSQEPEENILTNGELVSIKLPNTKLVILSACQTGIEDYFQGEGLIGLSRTFLAAGVPLVVASQWPVDEEATAELMKSFHFYRRQKKLSTTNALRQAQLDLLNAPDGRFRQPYFWAAFAAFGGYAEY
jgi:CHAT domain-containing protein